MNIELTQLHSFARELLLRVVPKTDAAFVMTLQGELGAGKTTFVQACARELGIDRSVQSPTFALMKKYPIAWHGFETFVHIDAYRLNGAPEFAALAPDTFLYDPHTIVCIEWPEQIEGALSHVDLALRFAHVEGEENMRAIEVVNKE